MLLTAIFCCSAISQVLPLDRVIFDQCRLVAYSAKLLNAHEADHGVIVISSAAWGQDSGMTQSEVAAMLAHELAHLELRDSKRMACEALAYCE